jgi:hypothetical protein
LSASQTSKHDERAFRTFMRQFLDSEEITRRTEAIGRYRRMVNKRASGERCIEGGGIVGIGISLYVQFGTLRP